jgi:hypothetical protein
MKIVCSHCSTVASVAASVLGQEFICAVCHRAFEAVALATPLRTATAPDQTFDWGRLTDETAPKTNPVPAYARLLDSANLVRTKCSYCKSRILIGPGRGATGTRCVECSRACCGEHSVVVKSYQHGTTYHTTYCKRCRYIINLTCWLIIPYGLLGMWLWAKGTDLLFKSAEKGLGDVVGLVVFSTLTGALIILLAYGTASMICSAEGALLRWLQSFNEPKT